LKTIFSHLVYQIEKSTVFLSPQNCKKTFLKALQNTHDIFLITPETTNKTEPYLGTKS